jgi:hypothetical protein
MLEVMAVELTDMSTMPSTPSVMASSTLANSPTPIASPSISAPSKPYL